MSVDTTCLPYHWGRRRHRHGPCPAICRGWLSSRDVGAKPAPTGNPRTGDRRLADLKALLATVEAVRAGLGTPSVLVHNAVSATFQTFLEADPEDLEQNFRVTTTALLYLARQLAPEMITAGNGAILVTGNTAALRGIPNTAVFAPTKAAQRILAQSLARDLGPKGVHVAYITIDAAIDTPWTRVPFHPDKPDDFFSKPEAIADEVFHVAHQDRSTWAFDLVIRPFAEKW